MTENCESQNNFKEHELLVGYEACGCTQEIVTRKILAELMYWTKAERTPLEGEDSIVCEEKECPKYSDNNGDSDGDYGKDYCKTTIIGEDLERILELIKFNLIPISSCPDGIGWSGKIIVPDKPLKYHSKCICACGE